MITLIRNGMTYAPEPLGAKDILVVGGKIAALAGPGQIKIEGAPVKVLDASGKTVLPGMVDSHVHILGGGGEGGPATRAPEINLEDIILNGVTTVIGCLGTDSVTRHMESLLAKARALEVEGVSSYIFSGAYDVPPKTITGNIRSDLVLIDKVIGAGEIAVSDHRSSQPTFEEIARLAAECRVGGMLGGKAGVLHLHIGDGRRKLEMLFRLVRETEIPITQIIPTHVNRSAELFEEAIAFALEGGTFDITAFSEEEADKNSGLSTEKAIAICLKRRVPLSQITVSSDSNGSIPIFDAAGHLVGLSIATERNLFLGFRSLVQKKILLLEDAIRLFSTNPASFYSLSSKGKIEPGQDADLILFDKDLELSDVYCRGKRMMADGKLIARGTFKPLL